MKFIIRISLLIFFPFFAIAQSQQKKLDSLNAALKTATNDTIRAGILYSLTRYYSESNRDTALAFAEQGIHILDKLHQPLWKADFLLRKAYLYQHVNLPLAFQLTNQSLALALDEKNERNVIIDPRSRFAGNPHRYRLNILNGVYYMLGNQYQATNLDKAIDYYKKEIQLSVEIGVLENLVNSNTNIGDCYLQKGKPDSAIIYLRRGLTYSDKTGYKIYKGNILLKIGDLYSHSKQADSAKYYYRYSIEVNKAQNNLSSLSDANFAFAKLYQNMDQPDSVLQYAKAAFNIATDSKYINGIAPSTNLIAEAYKMLGKTDSAYTYLRISKNTGDSLSKANLQKITEFQNINFEEQQKLQKEAQQNKDAKNRITTIALFAGLGLVALLALVFYLNNRQKQKANKILESTLSNLKSTQAQLIQSEKMASLGELTAGIAHEIQNPLNFVNNFSEVNKELLVELNDEIEKGNYDDAKAITKDVIDNEEKINHHGKRAGDIVKGMLQHSQTSKGQNEATDINALADEYLRLAYHGLKAKDKSFNATLKNDFDESIGKINIIPQDMGRVLLNLITNAFYAVDEKKKAGKENYDPTVSVSTKKIINTIEIKVADNGNGIPPSIKEKIFQPFFTTKPTGQGTGLGLSLAYDIVKAHGGELKVESKEVEGTTFKIIMPITNTNNI
ncbi:MAG: ATP-binding protein [Chitinophagaceae bacterium]